MVLLWNLDHGSTNYAPRAKSAGRNHFVNDKKNDIFMKMW